MFVKEPKALPRAKKGRETLDASLLIDLRTKINLTPRIVEAFVILSRASCDPRSFIARRKRSESLP